jgi:hypothetical protein
MNLYRNIRDIISVCQLKTNGAVHYENSIDVCEISVCYLVKIFRMELTNEAARKYIEFPRRIHYLTDGHVSHYHIYFRALLRSMQRNENRDSAVGIVTGYWLNDRG